jgi:hypothetical protein
MYKYKYIYTHMWVTTVETKYSECISPQGLAWARALGKQAHEQFRLSYVIIIPGEPCS